MELTTERLLLRDFRPGDREALLAYHADPRYTEFYGPQEGGPEQAAQLLDLFLRWQSERPRRNYQLAIVERSLSPDPVGNVGVRTQGCESGTAEFGLELAPACWGRGIATEAARALLDFGFHNLGLRRIVGISVTENERVARLVTRLGFRAAGTRPGPDWMQARGWSETEWLLTAEDWLSRARRS
jgi:ribosomal-protein-alanine N-acetyltransferase